MNQQRSLSDLTLTFRGTVYPWQCDHMGHMNVMWYVGRFDEATWNLFAALGITPEYLRQNQRGMAAIEQRISYRRELFAGDIIAIHSGVVEMKQKTIRFYHHMTTGIDEKTAASTQLVAVHMDEEIRRSCPFPPDIQEAGQANLIDPTRYEPD